MDFSISHIHSVADITESMLTVDSRPVPLRLVEVIDISEDLAGKNLYTFKYRDEIRYSYLTKQ
jgi:hypothetical protein